MVVNKTLKCILIPKRRFNLPSSPRKGFKEKAKKIFFVGSAFKKMSIKKATLGCTFASFCKGKTQVILNVTKNLKRLQSKRN